MNDLILDISKNYKSDKKEWIIEGYAALPGEDRTTKFFTEEALKKAEKDLLKNSTVFFDHQHDIPIGKVIDCKFDGKGLWVKIMISKTARKFWQLIKEGVLNGLSIGGRIKKAVKEYSEKLQQVITRILDVEIYEVSVVGLPANSGTRIEQWVEKGLKSLEEQEGGDNKMESNVEKTEEIKENKDTQTESTTETVEEQDYVPFDKSESEIEKAKKNNEKYPKPGRYIYQESLILKLKDILNLRKVENIKRAIKDIIEALEQGYFYYYEYVEEVDKSNENVEPQNNTTENTPNQTDTLENISKKLEELNSKILSEERIVEIINKTITELSSTGSVRKSVIKTERDEVDFEEELKKLPVEKRLNLVLKAIHSK